MKLWFTEFRFMICDEDVLVHSVFVLIVKSAAFLDRVNGKDNKQAQ